MSYLNGQIGYREELLSTRSVVRKGNFVLLEPDGLVKNSIPGYVNCDVTIMGSPEMGASFADYLVTAHAGGKNESLGGEGLETFLYVIELFFPTITFLPQVLNIAFLHGIIKSL